MNTAFILAIIVLGALSAALGAMLAAARREAGHLRADKTAAEQARLQAEACLLYTSPSPRDRQKSRMPSSA